MESEARRETQPHTAAAKALQSSRGWRVRLREMVGSVSFSFMSGVEPPALGRTGPRSPRSE